MGGGREASAFRIEPARGASAIELLFALGLLLSLSAAVVPQTLTAVARARSVGAARYLAARLQQARLEAVLRSADVGVQFVADSGGYTITSYLDGNANGVLSSDITSGADLPLAPPDRLRDRFRDVDFGLLPGLPAVDAGGAPPTGGPIKLGSTNILTFTPLGSSSSGSLYLSGVGGHQLVIRVYGATGKVRLLEFRPSEGAWTPL